MARYHSGGPIPTLTGGLYDYYTVDDLQELLQLAGVTAPKRKDDIVAALDRALTGEPLRALWHRLEPLQQAAVAEAVHGPSGVFNDAGFLAKYGEKPHWGTASGTFGRLRPSLLGVFFLGERTMPEDLRSRLRAFVPRPASATLHTTAELPEAWERRLPAWLGGFGKEQAASETTPLTRWSPRNHPRSAGGMSAWRLGGGRRLRALLEGLRRAPPAHLRPLEPVHR